MTIRHLCRAQSLTNEEAGHRARVLKYVIWSFLLVFDSQYFLFFFLLPENRARTLALLLTFNVSLPPLLLLIQRGYAELAGVLLMVGIWLMGTVLAFNAGGIGSLPVNMYLVDVLVAGLVYGAIGGVIAAIVFGLTALGLVFVENAGMLAATTTSASPLAIWLHVAINLEFVAIFQYFSNRAIRAASGQAKVAEAALRQSHDELEARVQERTAALGKANNTLQQVNQELEAFSYSVSHDLRRPLRSMTGFTDLLMEEHGEELSGDARNLLTLVKEGASQMNQLTESLLDLSRIDRQELVARPVNLTKLVRQTIAELREEQLGRNVDIRVADLPDCMGDPALLQQVFVNLISNALKYTRNRSEAVIEVGVKNVHEDAMTTYFVRDNGAGFDMRHADKLFGCFQRMHSAEEFSGNGVGLSIVRRIIHRHGGRIWAEAAVDKGATFYFTLPLVGHAE